MMSRLTFAALVVVTLAILVLIAVDRWIRPIPFVRKFGGVLQWALAPLGLLAVFLFGRLNRKKDDTFQTFEPEVFDDAPERELDADADDTDLEASATDRDRDVASHRIDERDERLDELGAELDEL